MGRAVERTREAIADRWQGDKGRISQAKQFLKKAARSKAKRQVEKASRKRNRGGR